MDVYVVDPASMAHSHFAGLAAFCITTIICAAVFSRSGRKGWWLIVAVGFIMPTLVTLAFGGVLPSGNWRWSEYLMDVIVPLGATIGVLSALLGVLVGMSLRWMLRRHGAA